MNSPFIHEKQDYTRQINPFKQYFEQCAHYLSIKHKKPYEYCLQWLKDNLKIIPGQSNIVKSHDDLTINDPVVHYIAKDNNGDRELTQGTLSRYIFSSIQNKELIAPTLTTYLNPSDIESPLVTFIDNKVQMRSIAKKAKFKAKMAKGNAQKQLDIAIESNSVEDIDKYTKLVAEYALEEAIQDGNQANAKTNNNSLSGAGAVGSTPLYNPTMHSTLTSTCRSASGYANANNEKLLCGNRHYHRQDIVLNNIVSIITNVDYDAIKNVINKYNLITPSANEMMEVILRSSRQYWSDRHSEKKIKEFIDTLNEYQRAAFCYVSDIYTLAQFNRSFVETMINDFSKKLPPDPNIDDKTIIDNSPEEVVLLAIQISTNEIRGKQLNDVIGTDLGKQVANIVKNILSQLEKYRDYIETFLRTRNVPASLSYFPSSIRHCALMSDTDSTIFTTEYWNKWMFGELKFDDDANRVFATMVFFAVSTLKHILALMSANFGIEEKRIHQIAMKNEFKFDVFIPTLKTKHYYAVISYQEGNVFNKLDQEIKGVHLIASNAPPVIIKEAREIMLNICETIKQGKKIELKSILKRMADREKDVIHSVKAGKITYYRGGQIRSADSYKLDEDKSNYRHYVFWNDTFGHKYGMAPAPPYSFIKLTSVIDNKTKTKIWLDEMEDRELSERISKWLEKTNRDKITCFLVPTELFVNQKLPVELTNIVDSRALVSDVCSSFYFILETLGVFRLNKNQTKLISDEF
jgi:hypothetical protein